MATSNYELKRGYVAQFDGQPFKGIKSFTNKELTDELAQEYLRRYPSRAVYFSRIAKAPLEQPVITIIPPAPVVEIIEPAESLPEKIIEQATNPRPKKKSNKRKR